MSKHKSTAVASKANKPSGKQIVAGTGDSSRWGRMLKAKGVKSAKEAELLKAVAGRARGGGTKILARIAVQRHRLLTAQADNAEADRDKKRRELVEVSRVLEALEKAESTKIARERAEFVVGLPARLGGQPADRIASAYEKALNEIHAEYVKQFQTLAGI